jgi:hypothetical protein
MVAMTLAAGLAIDISHLYLAGTELQNAADASALAGASMINGFSGGITAAVDKAVAIQNRYEFGDNLATINRSDVRFGVNLSDLQNGEGYGEAAAEAIADRIRFIKVTVPPKPIYTPFASVVLAQAKVNLTRTAVSGLSVGMSELCDVVIPLSATQDDMTHTPLNIVGSCSNTWAFTPGCKYVIRSSPNGAGNNGQGDVNSNDNSNISPGNYLALSFVGNGASDLRLALGDAPDICLKPGDEVSTKPGVNAGPVRQGLNTRFGEYQGGGLDPATFPPDTNVRENITYAQYMSGQCVTPPPANVGPGRAGRRIIVIPIINKSEFGNGRDTVRIYRLAAFFLQSRVADGNGGDIAAEYISTNVHVQNSSYDPNNPNGPQFPVPVLYY